MEQKGDYLLLLLRKRSLYYFPDLTHHFKVLLYWLKSRQYCLHCLAFFINSRGFNTVSDHLSTKFFRYIQGLLLLLDSFLSQWDLFKRFFRFEFINSTLHNLRTGLDSAGHFYCITFRFVIVPSLLQFIRIAAYEWIILIVFLGFGRGFCIILRSSFWLIARYVFETILEVLKRIVRFVFKRYVLLRALMLI